MLAQAPERGTKPALVDTLSGRALSYASLAAEVQALAEGLAANGVQPGDVLALCAPNSIEFAVTLYAATSAAATVATVNPQWTSEEIGRQLRSTGARWLVSTPGVAQQKVRAAARGTSVAAAFVMRHGAVVLESPDPLPGPHPVTTDVALASGRADRLSGRHLAPIDNLDSMLADIERIEREDLHTLRLRR